MKITASKLYDFLQCPHRIWRDVYGPQEEKIKEVNPFVQLLWDRGVSYEKKVISKIGDFLDLSDGSLEERAQKTIEAMKKGRPLIYQGVLTDQELRGAPDLLRRQSDGSYMPIDIKSGMGTEGIDMEGGRSGKLKKHYAVQLALYADILQRLGFAKQRKGIIFDIRGNEVIYDLEEPLGKMNKITLWLFYQRVKKDVLTLLENKAQNKPALAGICKLCPWYNSCKKWVVENNDLTGLFYVGRSKRDVINEDLNIRRIDVILDLDVDEVMATKQRDKNFLAGVGQKTLAKIVARANILVRTKKPVVYRSVVFPKVSYELFFDIEDDPTQEFVYLHGVYERTAGGERFLDFTAKEMSPTAEAEAWQRFWQYIDSLPENDFAVYYYSQHERNTYRRMQKIYPEVISVEKLEKFFDNPNVIDLYKIVLQDTDWPVGSYSLKTLAQYLGFKWRDKTPSGALSIQWFNEYLKTKDEKILKRILLYNEDDCRATMVLKDGIEKIAT